MKTLKIIPLGLLAYLMVLSIVAFGQTKEQKKAEIKRLINERAFTFIAESATPMGGGLVRLTSIYTVSVQKDSLNSQLPYFGVAYRANLGDTGSPLTFISTDFDYEMKEGKRGGYTINIKINKPSDPNLMILSISDSGYATLQVNSINRQQISFNGYVTATKQRRSK